MLSAVMLSVVMLSVIMLGVLMLSVFMLSVVMPSVVVLFIFISARARYVISDANELSKLYSTKAPQQIILSGQSPHRIKIPVPRLLVENN